MFQIFPSLQQHVKISVTLDDVDAGALELLKNHMIALAKRYVATWHSLGKIASKEEFFRVSCTDDLPSPDDGANERTECAEPRTRYTIIANLRTLRAPYSATSHRRLTTKPQTPEGFELVIQRVLDYDEEDWDDEDEDAKILVRKKFLLR